MFDWRVKRGERNEIRRTLQVCWKGDRPAKQHLLLVGGRTEAFVTHSNLELKA